MAVLTSVWFSVVSILGITSKRGADVTGSRSPKTKAERQIAAKIARENSAKDPEVTLDPAPLPPSLEPPSPPMLDTPPHYVAPPPPPFIPEAPEVAPAKAPVETPRLVPSGPIDPLSPEALAIFPRNGAIYKVGKDNSILCSPGAKHVADIAHAYWLLRLISENKSQEVLQGLGRQVWQLKVHDDHTADVSCSDKNGNELWEVSIDFTDIPVKSLTLWNVAGVTMLPSEY